MTHHLIVYGKRYLVKYNLSISKMYASGFYSPIRYWAKESKTELEEAIIFEDGQTTISVSLGDIISYHNIENIIKVEKVKKDLTGKVIEVYTDYVVHEYVDYQSKKEVEEITEKINSLKTYQEQINYLFSLENKNSSIEEKK